VSADARISGAEGLTYSAVNPTDLAPIDRQTLRDGPDTGVWVNGENAPRLFNRYGAEFLDDPDDVRLFPKGDVGPAVYESPPDFAVGIGDALLTGYRTFLTADGRFFADDVFYEPHLLQRQLDRLSRGDPFSNECTGLRPIGDNRFRFALGGRPVLRLDGTVAVVLSDEPQSYGSFLFRFLPKIPTLRTLGLTEIPILTHAPSESCRVLLNLLGIPDKNIIQHDLNAVVSIGRAIVPGLRNPNTYFDPETCELFAELRKAHGPPRQTRKIYVSRHGLNAEGGSTRVLLNEPALIARLEAIGFETIEPEKMPVEEQIHAFASASIVVGPSGSGLFNSIFCHPGTKLIDIQSEPHWIYSYAGMYASLGLRYGIFIGGADRGNGQAAHWPWRVNVDALIARVAAFSKA
jgi:capsular polysaccharide biosynthesis protein